MSPRRPAATLALGVVLSLALLLPSTAEARRGKGSLKPAPGTSLDEADAEDEDLGGEGESEGDDDEATESSDEDEADRSRSRRRLRLLQPGSVPAQSPPEGSLWDFIEKSEGSLPTGAAIEESEELDAERTEEEAFLEGRPSTRPAVGPAPRPGTDPSLAFYTDPSAAVGGPLTPDPDDPYFLKLVDPSEFDIPVVVNDDVEKWIAYFTGRGRVYYARWLSRSTRVRPMMYERLDAAGAPRDLVYLSMIESGYNTHAYSRAAAVGLWQFISATGRTYDLRVDWWVDERRDPYKATDAAIHFLTDLEKKFGHWYLAWAGYNGGPGRVSRALRTHGTDDFWTLVEKNAFPAETDNYVPKIIAAAIIGKHPERYGFTDIDFQEPLALEPVAVGPNISLDVLAKSAGVSVEDIQHYNPHLRRWATPPTPEETVIYVPTGTGPTFLAALAEIPEEERLTFVRHKVVKGETLGTIAARYGVSLADVQEINRITNPNRIYVGMELVVPVHGMPAGESVALAAALGGSSPSAPPKATQVSHTVQRGQNLSSIAARYGVKTSDLMRWNGITDANRIYVGQKLTLIQPATEWTRYTVRSGDNLTTIARKHGCTVAELQSWNKLSGEKIFVGQSLKIRK